MQVYQVVFLFSFLFLPAFRSIPSPAYNRVLLQRITQQVSNIILPFQATGKLFQHSNGNRLFSNFEVRLKVLHVVARCKQNQVYRWLPIHWDHLDESHTTHLLP